MNNIYLLYTFLIICLYPNTALCGKGKEIIFQSLQSIPSDEDFNEKSSLKIDKKHKPSAFFPRLSDNVSNKDRKEKFTFKFDIKSNKELKSEYKPKPTIFCRLDSDDSDEDTKIPSTIKLDIKSELEKYYKSLKLEILQEYSDSILNDIALYHFSLDESVRKLNNNLEREKRRHIISNVIYVLRGLHSGFYDIKIYLEEVYTKSTTLLTDLLSEASIVHFENMKEKVTVNFKLETYLDLVKDEIKNILKEDIKRIKTEISFSWIRNVSNLKNVLITKIHTGVYTITDERIVKMMDNLFFNQNIPSDFTHLVAFTSENHINTLRDLIYKIIISWTVRTRMNEWESKNFMERLFRFHSEQTCQLIVKNM